MYNTKYGDRRQSTEGKKWYTHTKNDYEKRGNFGQLSNSAVYCKPSERKRWSRRTFDQSFRFHCWFMHCIQIRWTSIGNQHSQTANESCYSITHIHTNVYALKQPSTHTHTHVRMHRICHIEKMHFRNDAKIWTQPMYTHLSSLRYDFAAVRLHTILKEFVAIFHELLNKC